MLFTCLFALLSDKKNIWNSLILKRKWSFIKYQAKKNIYFWIYSALEGKENDTRNKITAFLSNTIVQIIFYVKIKLIKILW